MTRWTLPPDKIPTAWFNVVPHLHVAAAAAAAPRHPGAGRARRPRPAVPDGAHRAGGERRAVDRRARRGARHPAAVAAHPAGAGRAAGEGAGHARRGSTSRTSPCRPRAATSPTPRCRRRSTTRSEGITRLSTETGRRAVGHRAGVRVRAVRPRPEGLHGPRVLRAEALPARSRWRLGAASVVPVTGRRARPPRLAGQRDLRRGARLRRPRRHPLRARARCSTTCCCTRP